MASGFPGVQYPTDVWLQAEIDQWQDSNSFEATESVEGIDSDDEDM